jgi:hypothetical protein
MAVTAEICPVSALSWPEREELFTLFCTAFQACHQGFLSDLQEKDFLLRVRDGAGLVAFSTLKLYFPEPGVRLLFSGDTYSAVTARNGHQLPARWARFVYSDLPHQPGIEDYWLLLCSGYRTYRILPTFFKTYVPCQDNHPNLKAKRDLWAEQLFCERYRNGVVTPLWPTPLLSPDPPPRLQADPHVRYFMTVNPGHREGDELACLVPLQPANLRPCGKRLLQGDSTLTWQTGRT